MTEHLARPPLRILVLDAQYCHALGALRSLGRHGAHVTAASHKTNAMSFASRYCQERLHSPSPIVERAEYTDWLLRTLRRGRYDATLFFEEATADILSLERDTVQSLTGCPLPERDVFLAADRKDQLARVAEKLGLPTPRTHLLQRLEDAEPLARTLEYPAIVKGVQSSGGQQVAVVRRSEDLVPRIQQIASLRRDPTVPLPVVQEFIPGTGYGLTALMRQGEPVAVFGHRRLAEHDVAHGTRFSHGATGAVSVDEPELERVGLQILRALRWDGIAMVEFRRSDRDGSFHLIEINPRFVGSLELAIAAGVDFPWLYAQLAAGRPVVGPNRYRVGLRFRWLVSKNVADLFERPWGYVFDALTSLRPDTRTDLSFRDPRPHWYQLRSAAWWIRNHLRTRPLPDTSTADLSA